MLRVLLPENAAQDGEKVERVAGEQFQCIQKGHLWAGGGGNQKGELSSNNCKPRKPFSSDSTVAGPNFTSCTVAEWKEIGKKM